MCRSSRLIRGAHDANPVMASVNALIMLCKEVGPGRCFHITIHIYIISHISTHAYNIHGFCSRRVRFGRGGESLLQWVSYMSVCVRVSACTWCVSLSACVCTPRGFLWCYRGNWMCGAHQKSPLALGKRSFNPSMPLWKAQPKVRLILSTGKHQMVPCSLHHSLGLCAPL